MTAPVDMVKTRLMLQRESKKVGMYRNGFHCAYQVGQFLIYDSRHLICVLFTFAYLDSI